MNYKEKYNAALERARYYHSKDYMLINSAIENIFPELKESEDEKIRKEIIAFLYSKNGYMTPNEDWDFHNRWLAWLEKQGEQKPNPYSGTSFEYNGHIWGMCARDNGVDILLDKQLFKHLENQAEHKLYGQRKECEDCQFNYVGECKGYCDLKRNEHKPNDKIEPKTLNVDKVIEWIYKYWPLNWGNFTLQVDDAIEKFKKDFGLC